LGGTQRELPKQLKGETLGSIRHIKEEEKGPGDKSVTISLDMSFLHAL